MINTIVAWVLITTLISVFIGILLNPSLKNCSPRVRYWVEFVLAIPCHICMAMFVCFWIVIVWSILKWLGGLS